MAPIKEFADGMNVVSAVLASTQRALGAESGLM
jgi:hypothetical protein